MYLLEYDLSDTPSRLAWQMVKGDLTGRLEGAYLFATDVIDDVAVPLPGYIKRRAEDNIIEVALERFADRVMATAE